MSPEASPLLAGPTQRSGCRLRLRLLLLCCLGCVERSLFYFFSVDTATDFTVDAVDFNDSRLPPTPTKCNLFDTRPAKAISPSSVLTLNSEYLVNGVGYLLPALGGLLADCGLGCKRTLVLGCCLYLTGAATFYAMLQLDECYQSLQLLSLLQLSAAVGLCKPSIAVLTLAAGRPRLRHSTSWLCYYAALSLGECLGCALSFAESSSRRPMFGYCLAAAAVMLLLASTLPDLRSAVGFELPSPRRLRAHFVLSATFIATIAICLTSFYMFGFELSSRLNCTSRVEEQTRFSQLWIVYSFGMLVACCLLIGCLGSRRLIGCQRLRQPELRVSLGLLLSAGSQVAAACVGMADSPTLSRWHLALLMATPTLLAAAAEAFVMPAGFELIYSTAQPGTKAFVCGIFIAVWGSGYFFMGLLLLLLATLPGNGLDTPLGGRSHSHLVHAMLACLMLLNWTAFQFGCRPDIPATVCEDDDNILQHFFVANSPEEPAAATASEEGENVDEDEDAAAQRVN